MQECLNSQKLRYKQATSFKGSLSIVCWVSITGVQERVIERMIVAMYCSRGTQWHEVIPLCSANSNRAAEQLWNFLRHRSKLPCAFAGHIDHSKFIIIIFLEKGRGTGDGTPYVFCYGKSWSHAVCFPGFLFWGMFWKVGGAGFQPTWLKLTKHTEVKRSPVSHPSLTQPQQYSVVSRS